jgi:hypothetical protein
MIGIHIRRSGRERVSNQTTFSDRGWSTAAAHGAADRRGLTAGGLAGPCRCRAGCSGHGFRVGAALRLPLAVCWPGDRFVAWLTVAAGQVLSARRCAVASVIGVGLSRDNPGVQYGVPLRPGARLRQPVTVACRIAPKAACHFPACPQCRSASKFKLHLFAKSGEGARYAGNAAPREIVRARC